MSKPGDVWVSPCGQMELRCGDFREVLAGVECGAVITDPPYGERTHADGASLSASASASAPVPIGYRPMTPQGVAESAALWSGWCSGWLCVFSCDTLHPVWRAEMEAAGRYAFPAVPVRQFVPRLVGDGPSRFGPYLTVSRPRMAEFMKWGTLPDWYSSATTRGYVRGGKPLPLMQAIVSDYSRPGDLVCDPCAGGGTTLLAAAIEGRRAIGAELDPETFDKAVARLSRGYTPRMVLPARKKQKQGSML